MRNLTNLEIDLIFGGTETAPTCTTSGSTTTCSCPSGMSLQFEQSAKKVEMTCTTEPVRVG
jgi:hypothetical protein